MNIDKSIKSIKRDSYVIADACRDAYFPLVVQSVDGSTIKDIDGNSYIDLLSSAATLNLGGSNSKINKAIINQINKFVHYTSSYSYNEPMIDLAEKLVHITPGNYKKKVLFGLSGSDANDAVIKVARAYTGRSNIITFIGGYHGVTYGAVTMSALNTNMKKNIGPFLPNIYSFNYPNCYRCNFGKEEESCNIECFDEVKNAFKTYLPADEVAAVIIEPIQGDSGIIIPPQKYIENLYELCDQNEILFISEEVQQGFGRTGKWFGIDHFDIIPDVVVLGKAIASGMPLSAVIGKKEIMESLEPASHKITIAANPVCCAAAIATIDVISEDGFLDNVIQKGNFIKEYFYKMKDKYEIIGDVRGIGLSIGVELIKDSSTKEKHNEAASNICYRCYEKGVVLTPMNGNVLRIQPPLNIKKEEILIALEVIESSIVDYLSSTI